ncbi:MAG TPA: NUDIX hydrolase [Candidatus Saccharimonadales bacterium]|nr:NUDIX hydrolase [Candidatus Saccharimonadales bacterium]
MTKTQHDSETLAEGMQVITAVAFIHRKVDGVEKVFLPKRATTKKFLPNVFELPGGHIDYGEDIVEGLKREVAEEFSGMTIRVGDPFGCFTYTNDVKRSHSIEVMYFAEFTSPIENIKLDPADHSEFVWVSKDELHTVYNEQKGEDDVEFVMVRKGFDLLEGNQPAFC